MSRPRLRGFGQDFADFGQGAYVKSMPELRTVKFNDFTGGFNVSEIPQDTVQNASPDMNDVEVDRRDRLVKAPGTSQFELMVGHSPTQIASHGSLSNQTEIITFAGDYVGINDGTGTIWAATTADAGAVDYSWASFAETFVFGNGSGTVRSHDFGSGAVVDEPLVPDGESFAVFAGRLFVGGSYIGGVKEPLGYSWSGVDGFNAFNAGDQGTGFEYLINDQSVGDRIVALRAMGLDMLAFLCRKSIWIGRRTGDLDRPVDVSPRVTGKGCVWKSCASTAYGGVIYLSDEGVELFDGNASQHLSAAIDSDLLPLDYVNIAKYSTAFDSTQQYFYLFTPDCTYVLDLLRQRWYRRSLVAFGGVMYSPNANPASESTMVFLGQDSLGRYALHEEDEVSFSNFGHVFLPYWTTQQIDASSDIELATTKRLRVRHLGAGDINLWLPDISSALEKVTPTPLSLPSSATQGVLQTQGAFTGLGGGLRIEIVSGNPAIGSLEQDVLPRGPRITPDGAFVPSSGLTGPFSPGFQAVDALAVPNDDGTYTITWKGTNVTLSVDGGAPVVPDASPFLVDQDDASHVYTFSQTVNGAPITAVVQVPKAPDVGPSLSFDIANDGSISVGLVGRSEFVRNYVAVRTDRKPTAPEILAGLVLEQQSGNLAYNAAIAPSTDTFLRPGARAWIGAISEMDNGTKSLPSYQPIASSATNADIPRTVALALDAITSAKLRVALTMSDAVTRTVLYFVESQTPLGLVTTDEHGLQFTYPVDVSGLATLQVEVRRSSDKSYNPIVEFPCVKGGDYMNVTAIGYDSLGVATEHANILAQTPVAATVKPNAPALAGPTHTSTTLASVCTVPAAGTAVAKIRVYLDGKFDHDDVAGAAGTTQAISVTGLQPSSTHRLGASCLAADGTESDITTLNPVTLDAAVLADPVAGHAAWSNTDVAMLVYFTPSAGAPSRTEYHVYRAPSSGGLYTDTGAYSTGSPIAVAEEPQFSGRTVYYKVMAVDPTGQYAPSGLTAYMAGFVPVNGGMV